MERTWCSTQLSYRIFFIVLYCIFGYKISAMNEINAVVGLIRWRVDLLDLNNLFDSYTLVIPNHVKNVSTIGDLLRTKKTKMLPRIF